MSLIWSKMFIGLHVKYQLLLSDFNEISIFSTDFRKIPKYQISWKSVQWWPSCSLRTDGKIRWSWRSLLAILRSYFKKTGNVNPFLSTFPVISLQSAEQKNAFVFTSTLNDLGYFQYLDDIFIIWKCITVRAY